jgi:chromosome segregation ATPase
MAGKTKEVRELRARIRDLENELGEMTANANGWAREAEEHRKRADGAEEDAAEWKRRYEEADERYKTAWRRRDEADKARGATRQELANERSLLRDTTAKLNRALGYIDRIHDEQARPVPHGPRFEERF